MSPQSHTFTQPVSRTAFSRIILYKLEWVAWSSPDVPLCSLIAQLLSFEQEFLKLCDWSKESIVNHTGCLTPCMYTEYSLATTPIYYEDGYFKIQIALTSLEGDYLPNGVFCIIIWRSFRTFSWIFFYDDLGLASVLYEVTNLKQN